MNPTDKSREFQVSLRWVAYMYLITSSASSRVATAEVGRSPACHARCPSRRARCCWCMVELNQQLLLLSAIGADQEHCPMVIEAAPSTCETDLPVTGRADCRWRTAGQLGLNLRALRTSWSSSGAAASILDGLSPASSSSSLQASWSSRRGLASTTAVTQGGPRSATGRVRVSLYVRPRL